MANPRSWVMENFKLEDFVLLRMESQFFSGWNTGPIGLQPIPFRQFTPLPNTSPDIPEAKDQYELVTMSGLVRTQPSSPELLLVTEQLLERIRSYHEMYLLMQFSPEIRHLSNAIASTLKLSTYYS